MLLTDLGPMRACRRKALLERGLRDRCSGYPLEMVLTAARAGRRIGEVDVDDLPRTGRFGTVRGTGQAVHDLRAALAEHSAASRPGSPS